MKDREAHLFIGLCLSALVESHRSPVLAAKLKSGQINWPLIVTISSRHLVTPALFASFQVHGLTEILESEVRNYLSIIHQLNLARNKNILKEVHDVVFKLNDVGVQPTLIKGAAHLTSGLYKDPGARIMSDIDMLVPESQLMSCVGALKSLGYGSKNPFDGELKGHHFPRLIHPNREVGIELHRWATSKNAIKAEEIFGASSLWEINGNKFRIPSREHALMINIIHAHTGALRFPGQINFRANMDHALLIQAPGEKVDWARISEALCSVSEKKAMEAFLDTNYWLMAVPLPLPLRTGLQLYLGRLGRKVCVTNHYFEKGILLTLFFIHYINSLMLRFKDLGLNEFLLRLTSPKKWKNQATALKNVVKSLK